MRTRRTDRHRNVRPPARDAQAAETSSPRFAQLPWALQDEPGIDAATIAVYCALQRHADFGRETGARVSDRVAAQKAGVSGRTFRDRRAKLRRLGWISWTSGKGTGAVNAYVVHQSRQGEGRQLAPTPSAPPAEEGSANGAYQVGKRRRGGRRQLPTTESQLPRASTESHVTENQDRDTPIGGSAAGAERRTGAIDENGTGGQPRDADGSPFAVLMPLVRQHLYAPDGKPPTDWDERRDASILQRLLAAGRSADDLAAVIEGVALLRDQPGMFGEDAIAWLGSPGSKLTCRVLLKRSGTATVWQLAQRAYWTAANRRPRGAPRTSAPVSIAALLSRGVQP